MNTIAIAFRPLAPRPRPAGGRRRSPFSGSYESTIDLLLREVDALGATEITIEADVPASAIRRDGMLSARARPIDPTIAVAFVTKRRGPLRFETGVFDDWHSNLRGIALGLEALRKVDRYGIADTGEQYAGWAALPASTIGFGSADAAATWLRAMAGDTASLRTLRHSYRTLAQRWHPDNDPDGQYTDKWERLQAAKLLLQQDGLI